MTKRHHWGTTALATLKWITRVPGPLVKIKVLTASLMAVKVFQNCRNRIVSENIFGYPVICIDVWPFHGIGML